GNIISDVAQLERGKKYTVVAKIKAEHIGNYEFVDSEGAVLAQPSVSGEYEFEYKDDSQNPNEPDDPNNPINPEDPTDPENPDDGNKDGNGGALDEILEKIKDLPLWQLIASVISIILIIAFLSKTASNESKRKKAKKVMEKKYNTFYATAFLGLSVTNWTVIASVLMGVAVLTFVFMLISQKRRNKAEEELEDARDEFERNKEEVADRKRETDSQRRDEDLKMILMSMLGGNAGNMQGGQGQQGYAYAGQPAVGMEEMRCMINEAVTALLPNVQQYLPQQASTNDELVQKLIEQNEKLMQKLSEQQPVERVIEKEVASANNNDETIKKLVEGQEKIMQLLAQQSNEKVVEKEVRVEVPVEVEKIVEKEVPVEKIVEVPVEVEKIVEKEVVKEVKVEVPVEVEKVVEKIVTLPAEKPVSKPRVTAPRLTLDEAYAKLSAKQK
ncbi:MAG: hypothetical protein K2I78_00765, partial [Clostridia bacterium]|nr:hypothetical protein [Clostridia bacterium]